MARMRIRTLLALSMGGLVLLATGAVLTIALLVGARNTLLLLNDRTVLMVDGIDKEVRDRFGAASDVVAGLVAQMQDGTLRGASPEALQDAFSVALATAPDVEVLLFWKRDMTRWLVARQPDGTITREGPVAERNPEIREGLAQLSEGARQWGAPVEANDTMYVNYAAHVRAAPADVTYVVAAVSLQQFSRFLAEIGGNYGGTAFILYGKDDVLAHPSFAKSGRVGGHPMTPIAKVDDPVLAGLAGGRPVELLEEARRRFVETLQVRAEGSQYLVMYRWLYGFGPQPLAVGAYLPRTEITDTLRRLVGSAVAGVTVAALGVLAAIVLGGFIARPVRRLSASAAAVARLDLDAVEPPPRSLIAEVDEQGRAFTMMLDALRTVQAYVPRRLVERLVALDGERDIPSEARDVTVMFTDMVHFSEISERMGAEETASFLNRHFGLLAACIQAEGGTIDKYIGDAVMAFWGVPDHADDHAARATAAARRIAEVMTADNQRRAGKGLRPVRVRVGIHSGPVVVGNIGTPDRMNYTIVGDTVNDAQRLEALGRLLDAGHDVTVLMSAETAREAGLGADEVEDVGMHQLAGGPHRVAVRRMRQTG